jgi:hypothetical protein
MGKNMTEKYYEKKLVSEVKKLGGLALKIYCASITGFPDRLIILRGTPMCFVEVKGEGIELNPKKQPRQLIVKNWLESMGVDWYLINSAESLNKFLNERQIIQNDI